VWHLLPDELSRSTVELAERYADQVVAKEELLVAEVAIISALNGRAVHAVGAAARAANEEVTCASAVAAWIATIGSTGNIPKGEKRNHFAKMAREFYGPPDGPIIADSRWLTSTVLDLARLIYDERAFDRLPILADALMDAGCDDEALLAHCRSDGPHVRGCWAIDLLLGKS
jgi:hypothetical protein